MAGRPVAVLCHGFMDTRDAELLVRVAEGLGARGVGAVRFDFSGNGESEGAFELGNYAKERGDLRAVVEAVRGEGGEVAGVAGHSKGGNCVLLYCAEHGDVPRAVNIAGRFDPARGVAERFGQAVVDAVLREGAVEMRGARGPWTLTRESYEERLRTDMAGAAARIPASTRVLHVHGTADRVVPAADAVEFHRRVPSSALRLVDGASHNFSREEHRAEVVSAVVDFLAGGD